MQRRVAPSSYPAPPIPTSASNFHVPAPPSRPRLPQICAAGNRPTAPFRRTPRPLAPPAGPCDLYLSVTGPHARRPRPPASSAGVGAATSHARRMRPPAPPVGPEGKGWKVRDGAEGGAGEVRFSAPSPPNGSSHHVSRRLLCGSHFFAPLARLCAKQLQEPLAEPCQTDPIYINTTPVVRPVKRKLITCHCFSAAAASL
jgi:hypothetical protein